MAAALSLIRIETQCQEESIRMRKNRLFFMMSGMALIVSCLEVWLGHVVMLHRRDYPMHISRYKPQSQDRLSLTQVYRDMQNRTMRSSMFCNETTPHLRGKFRLQVPHKCNYPPKSACDMSEYAILFMSTASHPRILFLNLLKALTHSNHVQVLLLHSNATSFLKNNVPYGHRILSWHGNGIVDLWEGTLQDSSTPTAVLWMDGDTLFAGTYRDLQVGFELWKRHSDSLVAAHLWPLQQQPSSALIMSLNNETFVSICRTESLTLSDKVDSPLQLVELFGLWMHSDFLCLLPKSTSESKLLISVWLMQLAQSPLYLYPMASSSSLSTSPMYNNNSSWIDESILTKVVGYFGGIPIGTREYGGVERRNQAMQVTIPSTRRRRL